jgi:hypothetical protein
VLTNAITQTRSHRLDRPRRALFGDARQSAGGIERQDYAHPDLIAPEQVIFTFESFDGGSSAIGRSDNLRTVSAISDW